MIRAATMPSVDLPVLLQRPAGLGVHEVEQESNTAVILQLVLFLGGELAVVILCHQLVHPVKLLLIEADGQPSLCGRRCQCIIGGPGQMGEDRGVAGGRYVCVAIGSHIDVG